MTLLNSRVRYFELISRAYLIHRILVVDVSTALIFMAIFMNLV